MTAREMLERCADDALGRLRWRVMGRLGISPVSLRARLLTRRRVLALACHMVLDAGGGAETAAGCNPSFDMARFRRLAEGGSV